MDHFWHFWLTFVHSKCKRSSLRSQCWMRHFQSFSNIVTVSEYVHYKNCTSNDYLTFYSARAAAHSSAPRSSKFLGLNLKLQTSTCRLQAKLRMQPTCYYLCPNSSYIHQLSLELLSLLLLLLTFSNHPPMTNHFLYRKCTPRLLNEVFIISEALLEEVF